MQVKHLNEMASPEEPADQVKKRTQFVKGSQDKYDSFNSTKPRFHILSVLSLPFAMAGYDYHPPVEQCNVCYICQKGTLAFVERLEHLEYFKPIVCCFLVATKQSAFQLINHFSHLLIRELICSNGADAAPSGWQQIH